MRQFIAETFPDNRGILNVGGKDYRYFRQVLRVKSGDMIAVRLPDSSLQNMTVCLVDEKARMLQLQICASKETITRGTQAADLSGIKANYWLFQFVAKPAKMDVIIRQAVECGVSRIVPIIGDYSQKENCRNSPARRERIDRIIKEARQQSGSPYETICTEPVLLKDAAAMWKEQNYSDALQVVLYERTEDTVELNSLVSDDKRVENIGIAVGCEGGISPAEIAVLKENGFLPVHFETNILRCETAALYGIAAMQTLILGKK